MVKDDVSPVCAGGAGMFSKHSPDVPELSCGCYSGSSGSHI